MSRIRLSQVAALMLRLCCIFVSPTAMTLAQDSISEAGLQIHINISTSKKQFKLREPVFLKLQIENIGRVPVLIGNRALINTRQDTTTTPYLDLELWDEHGRSSPGSTLIADSFGIPTKAPAIHSLLGGWLVLEPKSSYTVKLTIDRADFEFLGRPGKFRLSGKYHAPDVFDPATSRQLGLTEEDLKAIPAKCWSGRLKFQPIRFEILPD